MNRVLYELPEAFVSHTAISRVVSRAVRAGRLRKLASRLYTKNLDDPPEEVVKRNLWGIVAAYFPRALVADRTALEAGPGPDGSLCLVSQRGTTIELPGVVLRPRRGTGPIASDMPFVGGLYFSSRARAFLENMRPSRARSGRVPRTLTRSQVEERLDRLIRMTDEADINRIRDDAQAMAAELDMEAEAARLRTPSAVPNRASRAADPCARPRAALDYRGQLDLDRRDATRTRRVPRLLGFQRGRGGGDAAADAGVTVKRGGRLLRC